MNPYVGEIRLVAMTFAPAGWELCHGQLMSIADYDTLFNLIGTTYGGDGQSTFALPDLRGRVPVGAGTGTSGGSYVQGQAGGVEMVTLSAQHMPAHSHPLVVAATPGTHDLPSGGLVAAPPALRPYGPAPASSTLESAMSPQTVRAVGGGQPHENMQPYLVVNYIISLYGIFPSQS